MNLKRVDKSKLITVNEIDLFKLYGKNILVNYISGACDIVEEKLVNSLVAKKYSEISLDILKKLIDRKYVFVSHENYKNYIDKLNSKLELLDANSYPNFVLIPSYACNLSCKYCYEKESIDSNNFQKMNSKTIMSVIKFIEYIVNLTKIQECNEFDSSKIIFTLMGGEPLLKENKEIIDSIISYIYKNGYSYNIISNGLEVNYFMDIFSIKKPIGIQITLDGMKETHNRRRCKKDGSGSFEEIIENIHNLLDEGIQVQIRLNLDEDNLSDIMEFSSFLDDEFGQNKNLQSYLYPIQDGGCVYENNIIKEEEIIDTLNKYSNMGKKIHNIKKLFHGSNLISSISYNKKLFSF